MSFPVAAMAAMQAVQAVSSIGQANSAISVAKQERTNAYLTGNANEEVLHASNAQKLGEQRAAAGQSGFQSGEGSLATLQTQSAGNAFLGELQQRYQGQINAWKASNEIATAVVSKRVAGIKLGFAAAGGSNSAWNTLNAPTDSFPGSTPQAGY